MKKLFAISTLTLLVTVGGAAPASAAQMTAQGCKDAGGTWTHTALSFGMCTIAKRVGAGNGGPSPITADKCKELGGEMGTDNKCRITTKNLAVTAPPPKL